MPEQEDFFDAIYADPDMTDANKAKWLHNCASEYATRMRLCQRIMIGEISVAEMEDFLEVRDDLIRVPSPVGGEVKR